MKPHLSTIYFGHVALFEGGGDGEWRDVVTMMADVAVVRAMAIMEVIDLGVVAVIVTWQMR